jgi:hypothetical protein
VPKTEPQLADLPRHPRRWRRALGLAVLLPMLLPASLALPVVREALLHSLLRRVARSLPGELRLESLAWPAPGRLQLEGLLWRSDGDTLLACRELELDLRPGALLGRRLELRELRLTGLLLDLPALRRLLPAAQAAPAAADGAAGGGWLRAGSLPGLPSLACGRLRIEAGPLILDPTLTLPALSLQGGFDLSAGRVPWLRLEQLELRETRFGMSARADSLLLEPGNGRLSGTLQAALGPERRLELRVESAAVDRWSATGELVWDGAPLRLALGGAVLRSLEQARGLSFAGELQLPGAAKLHAAGLLPPGSPGLPSLGVAVSGELAFDPREPSHLRLRLSPNDWALRGGLLLQRAGPSLAVDSLHLALEDLRLEGRLQEQAGDLEGHLDLQVSGTRGLSRLGMGSLDELRAGASLRISGSRRNPALTLDLAARGGHGNARLDTLQFRLDGGTEHWQLRSHAEAAGQRLSLAAAITQASGWNLRLDTLRLDEIGAPSRSGSGGGRVHGSPTAGVVLEELHLAGNWLDLQAGGRIDARGSGQLGLTAQLLDLPAGLRRQLAGIDPERGKALAADLCAGEAPRLEAWLQFAPGGVLEARLAAQLPGPAGWRALLPPGAELAGLGPLHLRGRASLPTGRVDLGAAGEGWLDTLAVQGRMQQGRWQLDSLVAILPGLRLMGAGAGDPTALDLQAVLHLDSLPLAQRFHPELASWKPRLQIGLRAEGAPSSPRLAARIHGSLSGPELQVPVLQGRAHRDGSGLSADLRLTGGLRAGSLGADSLVLAWQGSGSGLPGQLDLRLHSPGGQLSTVLAVSQPEDLRPRGLRLQGLHLALETRDGGLAAPVPFRVILPGTGGLRLEELELKGSLGRLSAELHLAEAQPRLRLDAELSGGLAWLQGLPEALQPSALRLALRIDGDTLRAGDLRLAALPLAPGRKVDLRLGLFGSLADPRFELRAIEGADTLLRGGGRLPLTLGLVPFAVTPRPERFAFHLRTTDLPLPLDVLLPAVFAEGESGRLSGELTLDGGFQRPEFRGGMQLHFAAARLKAWELRLGAGYGEGQAQRPGEDPLLQAKLELRREDRAVLSGELRLPMIADAAGLHAPGELQAWLAADSLDLERLNDWLPADLWLEGRGSLRLRAEGPSADPRLEGRARIGSVKISQSSGTRLFASADLRLQGRLRQPGLVGWIALDNGRVAIPQLPRDRHPVRGEALLWTLHPAPGGEEPVPSPQWLDSLAFDVELRVPRPIRFEGGDLALAASGDLRLVGHGTAPRVSGELEATEGRFRLLGRTIEVQRGQLGFYGDEILDPTLDLLLSTAIDASEIFVALGGSFLAPRLELSSEPPMEEGEILALLLFGRPAGELDVDQQDLLQQRATQMATDFGMARLSARLVRDLGLDLLRYQANGLGGRSSLEVGKYIGPRVFVRYEQAIDQQDLFRLQLDYILTRRLRLESSYGRQSQSGLQLNWIRSY